MLTGLQQEIDAHPELVGSSAKKRMEALNQDGSAQVESYVVKDDVVKIPKGDMMAMMSVGSLASVITWMRAEADATAMVFHEFFNAHEQFKVTDPMFRAMISGLAPGLITTDERDAILRLGERPISRAEEVFGRKLTMEDFE